jgi:DUF971 family protein
LGCRTKDRWRQTQCRAIIDVSSVGNYAIRLDFDDLHRTGIYIGAICADLGRNFGRILVRYLEELATKGLDRDRPGEK